MRSGRICVLDNTSGSTLVRALIAAVAVVYCCSSRASATTMVSNLGQNWSGIGYNFDGPENELYGTSFTTGADPVALTSVTIALGGRSGPSEFDLTLLSDNAGLPSTNVLYSFFSIFPNDNGSKNYSTSAPNVPLAAGTTYWIVAGRSPSPTGHLLTTSTSEDGGAAPGWSIGDYVGHSLDGGTTWEIPTQTLKDGSTVAIPQAMYFSIDAVAAPEPHTLVLTAMAICGVARLARRRFRNRKSQI